MGNPCKCSSHSGLIGPPAWEGQSSPRSAWFEYPRLCAVAVAVGNNRSACARLIPPLPLAFFVSADFRRAQDLDPVRRFQKTDYRK